MVLSNSFSRFFRINCAEGIRSPVTGNKTIKTLIPKVLNTFSIEPSGSGFEMHAPTGLRIHYTLQRLYR